MTGRVRDSEQPGTHFGANNPAVAYRKTIGAHGGSSLQWIANRNSTGLDAYEAIESQQRDLVLPVSDCFEGQFGDALAPDAAEAVVAFRRAFFAVSGCLAISLVCLAMIEERPLRTSVKVENK